MKEENLDIDLPWLSEDDWRRMGFLQLSILSSLLIKERYGLQIREHLMLNGYEIGTNQLYAALSRLDSQGHITMREEERRGVNRKYYILTEKGRAAFVRYSLNFIILLQDLYPLENLTPLSDLAWKILEPHISATTVIFDFSTRYTENQFAPIVSICTKLKKPGHINILSQKEEYREILQNKITHYHLDDVVSIINLNEKSQIKDNSIDLVICNFMLHHPQNEWIIPEINRILKPKGIFLLVNPLEMDISINKDIRFSLLVSFRQLSPFIQKSGINPDEILRKLKINNLKVLDKQILNGVVYFFGTKILN